MTPCTKIEQSKYTAILPEEQTPAITEIWRSAHAVACAGLARGFSRQVVAAAAAATAHNHPRRRELPGDPAEQFLRAHELGFEVVRHVLAKLEGVA